MNTRFESYTTLLKIVRLQKDLSLFHLLKDKGSTERVGILKSLFLLAGEEEGDETALRYLKLLGNAMDESLLIGGGCLTSDQRAYVGEIYREPVLSVLQHARMWRARLAIELYQTLPETTTVIKASGGSTELAFPATRKALVGEILTACFHEKTTREDADVFFSEFIEMWENRPFRRDENTDIFLEPLKEATGHGTSQERLVQCFLKLAEKRESGLARVLSAAIARGETLEDLANALYFLEPLRNCSRAALTTVRESADKVVTLDKKIQNLLKSIDFGLPYNLTLRYERVQGLPIVQHIDVKYISLAVYYRAYGLDERDENELHDMFEKIRAQIEERRREEQLPQIHFALVIHQKSNQSELFRRESGLLMK